MSTSTPATAPKRYIQDGARVLDTEEQRMAPTTEERTAKQLAKRLNSGHIKANQLKWLDVAKK